MVKVTISFDVNDTDYATLLSSPSSEVTFKMFSNVCSALACKFAAGQREHGGDFWKKKLPPRELDNEILDLLVYREHEKHSLLSEHYHGYNIIIK